MRVQSVAFALILTATPSGQSSLRASENAHQPSCSELIRVCQELAHKKQTEERAGLWERLRDLRKACDEPDVSPELAASAASLYFMLPEYSSWNDRLEVLHGLELRLREPGSSVQALIDVVESTSATLALAGREEEARDDLLEALELRRARYGAESSEAATGLLYLGQFYANWSEKDSPSVNRKKAIAYGQDAVELLWVSRGEKDPEVKKLIVNFDALLDHLGLERAEKERLINKYKEAPGPQ